MNVAIVVSAAEAGWRLHLIEGGKDELFTSGAAAEAAAYGLARSFADQGRTAEVSIYLRDGSLGSRRRYEGR